MLEHLELRYISASCDSFNPNSLVNMTKLKYLDLSVNKQFSFPLSMIGNIPWTPNLEYLNLSHNFLRELNSEMFRGLTKLRILDLSNNRIRYVEAEFAKHLVELTDLNLSNNNLDKVEPFALSSNSLRVSIWQILRILVSNNMSIISRLFYSLPNLEKLYLRNCFAQHALSNMSKHSNLFKKLHRLKHLNLVGNFLHGRTVKQHVRNLTTLESLDLSNNVMHQLDEDIFKGLSRSLKYLNIKYNHITTVNLTSLPRHWWTHLRPA